MLTQKELKLVKQYARIVSNTLSFPFDWKKDSLHPTTSIWKKIGVTINFLFSVCYSIYLLARLSPKFGGYTPASMPFHAFAIICHFVYFTFHLHCFIYTSEMALFFNQLVYFNFKQGKLQFDHYYLPPNFREKIIAFLHRWINGVAITIAGLFLIAPNNSHFLYTVLPSEWRKKTYPIFLVIEGYLAYKIMIFHLFIILYGFFYIVSTNFWLHKVCIEWSKDPSKTMDATKFYRYLTLLNKLYNKSLATFVIPVFKSLIEICVVICTYGSIRLYDKIPLQAYIMLPGLASFLFVEHQFAVDKMADVHDVSSQFEHNFKLSTLNREKKYLVRFFASCRPIRCQLTHALFVEKSTKLVLLHMLLNMLVSLLVGGNNK